MSEDQGMQFKHWYPCCQDVTWDPDSQISNEICVWIGSIPILVSAQNHSYQHRRRRCGPGCCWYQVTWSASLSFYPEPFQKRPKLQVYHPRLVTSAAGVRDQRLVAHLDLLNGEDLVLDILRILKVPKHYRFRSPAASPSHPQAEGTLRHRQNFCSWHCLLTCALAPPWPTEHA